MSEHFAGTVTVRFEPPGSDAAQACLVQYFAELAIRFEAGFDAGVDPASRPDELEPPSGYFAIAWRDGLPVGCGGLKRVDSETGEIKRVWTSPAARGLGVAGRIMRTLEDVARECRFTRVRLDTNRALVEARAMYRRLGYREIGRYNDNPFAHHWFEKALG